RACRQAGQSVARALRLPVILTDDLVSPAVQQRLTKRTAALDISSLQEVHHRGHPIGRFALNSTRWFLCGSDLAADPEASHVFRTFVQSATVIAEAAPLLFDRVRPDVVFMLNGLFWAERIIKAEAERRGIRVVSYERGYMPDTLCVSEGIPGYCEIDPLWDQVKDAILTPEQEARLDDYLAARRTGLRAPVNYWPTIREDEREIRDSLKLAADRPLAVLFTNITWDSAVLGRDRVFPDMYTWVVESIRLFA